MAKVYCIYEHVNKINGKKYIGQTCDIEKRWSCNGYFYKGSTYFYHAIQKYGWDNFEHNILLTDLTKEEADFFEEKYILENNTLDPKKGYNLTSGGKYYIFSDLTKQKMSESAKKRLSNEDELEKMRQRALNNWQNEEYRNKVKLGQESIDRESRRRNISKALQEKLQDPEYLQYRKNISRQHFGIKIQCINTGEIFRSQTEAAEWAGLKSTSGISKCCLGERKSAGRHPITKEKLQWCYYSEKGELI